MRRDFSLLLEALGLSAGLIGHACGQPIITAQADATASTSVTSQGSEAVALGQSKAIGQDSASTYIFVESVANYDAALALSVAISGASANSILDFANNPEIQTGINDLVSIFSLIDPSESPSTTVYEPNSLIILSTGLLSFSLYRISRGARR